MSRRRFAIGMCEKPGSPGLALRPRRERSPSAGARGGGHEALTRIAQQEFEARFDKREAARMLEISLASLYRKLGEA